jgi:EmrB/QacA subfamily drug resistance transporter
MMLAHTNDTGQRRWLGLALLCTAFFMVILDAAVVNVALPSIQADLGFSAKDLQWVVSAYALTFGGLLLLGGRAADLLGRRRIFLVGVAVFSAASLLGGIAWSDTAMIVARALQGVGAAIMTPAALSILTTTFEEGAERNKALGIWGAVGASGGTFGLIVGGVLADTVGWEWIFLLNVPIGLTVIALTPFLVGESRRSTGIRHFDLAGALTSTAAIALLVYATVDANDAGWGSAQTVGLFLASAGLLAVFVVVESRSAAPLMPFQIFRLRSLAGSNAAGLAFGGAVFGMFFVITLYLQQVLGFSPLQAGLAWLATSLTVLVSAMLTQGLVTRVGTRVPLIVGSAVSALGVFLLSRVSADESYLSGLMPAMIVTGVGMGTAFVSMSIGALEGVAEHDAGLASGLINTSQQVGAALGVAILSSVAIARTQDVLLATPGTAPSVALTEGFRTALLVGAGFALAGALLAAALIRRHPGNVRQAADETPLPERAAA